MYFCEYFMVHAPERSGAPIWFVGGGHDIASGDLTLLRASKQTEIESSDPCLVLLRYCPLPRAGILSVYQDMYD